MFTLWKQKISGPGSIVCKPGTASQWIMRNRESHREYHGLFTLVGRNGQLLARLAGRVVEWPGLPVDVYIFDPPLALRKHRHGRCLQLLIPGSRWFKLHWERPAKNLDQARAYVEQLMAESWIG